MFYTLNTAVYKYRIPQLFRNVYRLSFVCKPYTLGKSTNKKTRKKIMGTDLVINCKYGVQFFYSSDPFVLDQFIGVHYVALQWN